MNTLIRKALTCSRSDTKAVKCLILLVPSRCTLWFKESYCKICLNSSRTPACACRPASCNFFSAVTNSIYLKLWNKPNVFLESVIMLETLFSRSASSLSWIEWHFRVPRIVQRGNTCRANDRYCATRNTLPKQYLKFKGAKLNVVCVQLLIAVLSNYLYIWPGSVTSFLCDAKVLLRERH